MDRYEEGMRKEGRENEKTRARFTRLQKPRKRMRIGAAAALAVANFSEFAALWEI